MAQIFSAVKKTDTYQEPTVEVHILLSTLVTLIKKQGGPEGISFETLLTRIVAENAPQLLAFMLDITVKPFTPLAALGVSITRFDRRYELTEYKPYSMQPYVFTSDEGYVLRLSEVEVIQESVQRLNTHKKWEEQTPAERKSESNAIYDRD